MAYWRSLKGKLQNLNLFEDEKRDRESIKNQKISTYVFFVLLLLLIIALVVYTLLTRITKTVNVEQPDLALYQQLYLKYPNTLICPCTSVLNEYNKFIVSFSPMFNQICSSDFVKDEWLNYVNYRPFNNMKYQYVYDFRYSAYSFFQMLRTLCSLSSQIINDQLVEFYSTVLLSETVYSFSTFNATINAARDLFIATTENQLQLALNILSDIEQGSLAMNHLHSNYMLATTYIAYYDNPWIFSLHPIVYQLSDNCRCDRTTDCRQSLGIYRAYRSDPNTDCETIDSYPDCFAAINGELEFEITGTYLSCSVLMAVKISNLSCLYNSSCLTQLNTYLMNDTSFPFTATPLKNSSSSFPTVGDVLNKLMVDEWIFNSSYENYFSECNPHSCTYTDVIHFDVIYVVTTIIGFISGVLTVLMLLTLPIITFLRKRRNNSESLPITFYIQRFLKLPSKIKEILVKLNLFKDPEEATAHDLINQLFSTRLYIILMFISLFILVLYTGLAFVTKTVVVERPSVEIFNQLQDKYSQTLVCPCTNISIKYGSFISFQPTFHQICQSDFVTQNWLNFLETPQSAYQSVPIIDIRAVGESYYRTLSDVFCQGTVQQVENALLVFNSTNYITKNVQDSQLFQLQIQNTVKIFKETTINSFLQLLSMNRRIIIGNQLLLQTNWLWVVLTDHSHESHPEPSDLVLYPNYFNNCSCKTDPNCGQLGSISNYIPGEISPVLDFVVPGFNFGCYQIESILVSTFECLYNQSCIDTITALIYNTSSLPFNATAMNYSSTNSRYTPTTKIQDIIDQLMIEQWNDNISFPLYFSQCKPNICVYTYNVQGDIFYVVTTIISLVGGLTTIFRLFIPPIVSFIRRKKRPVMNTNISDNSVPHTSSRLQKLLQMLKTRITTFNLFKNPNKRSNKQLHEQRLSTRLFILLLAITLIILLIYTTTDNVTQSVTKKNPSIDQFNFLQQKYPNTVQCPCSKTISIEYQNFISFQVRLHSICSSDFLNSASPWFNIDYPLKLGDAPTFRTQIDDFRHIAGPFFQMLSFYYELSLEMLNTALLSFNSTQYITPNLVSIEQFQTQTNQFIYQFQKNTAQSFISNLNLINNMTHANQLESGLLTDSILTVYPQYYHSYYYYSYYYIYDRKDQDYNSSGIMCDCEQTPYCIQQAVVYDLNTAREHLFSIEGIYVGCYIAEAVLLSDLRCFFDSAGCLTELTNALGMVFSANISSLSNSSLSRYKVNTPLLDIVSNLMIEEWTNVTSFDNYFNECQPSLCTATYINRGNLVFVITTTIALIGGLTKLYKFLVPLFVAAIFRVIIPYIRRKMNQNRVMPEVAITTIQPTE